MTWAPLKGGQPLSRPPSVDPTLLADIDGDIGRKKKISIHSNNFKTKCLFKSIFHLGFVIIPEEILRRSMSSL